MNIKLNNSLNNIYIYSNVSYNCMYSKEGT